MAKTKAMVISRCIKDRDLPCELRMSCKSGFYSSTLNTYAFYLCLLYYYPNIKKSWLEKREYIARFYHIMATKPKYSKRYKRTYAYSRCE